MTLQPIGTYRYIAAGGLEPLYATTPVYGHRSEYLPMIGRYALQVLVRYIGDWAWVNANRGDVTLFPCPPARTRRADREPKPGSKGDSHAD